MGELGQMSPDLLNYCTCGGKSRDLGDHPRGCGVRKVAELATFEGAPWVSPLDAARWALNRLSPAERRRLFAEYGFGPMP